MSVSLLPFIVRACGILVVVWGFWNAVGLGNAYSNHQELKPVAAIVIICYGIALFIAGTLGSKLEEKEKEVKRLKKQIAELGDKCNSDEHSES
jgi:hypothetical protein